MPSSQTARNWYQGADAVHDFEHVLRVYHLAEKLAQRESADLEIVRAAALLHDARGSAPGEGQARLGHHLTSALFAAEILTEEHWPQEKIAAVQHCIRAHRFRSTEKPSTIEAKVVFDADKLDAIGAVGAARTIAYAALDGKPFYADPSEKFLQTFEKEPGEPHTAYHEFLFKLAKIKDRLYTPSAKEVAEARHAYLASFFEQLGAEYKGER